MKTLLSRAKQISATHLLCLYACEVGFALVSSNCTC